jgi:uncharacterized membrane protein
MFGLAGSRRRREEVGEYVRGSLWVLPGIAVLAALVAGSVLSLVPVPRDGLLYKLVFQGTPDDARTLLIGTAGTMISVVAVVLGLTVVALQVASSQYSPRLLGNFLRDRHTQIVLSVFVATFAYSTAGLYTVGISGGGRVEEFPRLAVTGAILLLFASLGFLVYFIDHLAHSIQLDTIIDVVQQNTSVVIAHLPDTGETGALAVPAQAVPILAWRSGYIQWVHPEDLYEAAKAAEVVINLVPRVGDHVVENTPIAWWWPDESAHAGARVTERLESTSLRQSSWAASATLLQDAAFGMRQLVDIALKTLSPAINFNDPYTAVMSVERLTALLAALAPRRLGDIVLHDPEGPSRVVVRFPTFADYVDLAIGQIRRYGASEPQVAYALTTAASGSRRADARQRPAAGAGHPRTARAGRRRTHHLPARGSGPSAERGRDPTPGTGRLRRPSDLLELAHDESDELAHARGHRTPRRVHGIPLSSGIRRARDSDSRWTKNNVKQSFIENLQP